MTELQGRSFVMCSECKRCCQVGPSLHKREIPLVEKQIGRKIKVRKYGNIYRPISKPCLFLGKDGCVLKEKPLGCYIWPFMPSNKGWIMRIICKHWQKITKKDFEDIKKYYEKRKHFWKDVVKLR